MGGVACEELGEGIDNNSDHLGPSVGLSSTFLAVLSVTCLVGCAVVIWLVVCFAQGGGVLWGEEKIACGDCLNG